MNKALVTHLLTLIRRGDSQKIEAARDRVSPEHLPELLAAYWGLDSWEQRTDLLHLCADHLVPEARKVMRHYLTTPQTDDPAAWSKIVALCQLAGTWELYDRLWDDRDLLESAIERALAGETPSLALLDRLQSAARSASQAQKQPTGRVDREVAELLEIVRRGDVMEIEESRLRVQPEHLPELLAAYWGLDNWEQRARLLLLVQEHPVVQLQESGEILRHFLGRAVGDDSPDLIREAKIVALSHLIQNPWFPPHQLGKGKPRRDLLRRWLVRGKQELSLALLDELESGRWPPPRDEQSPPPAPAPEPATLPSQEALRLVVGVLKAALLQVTLIDDLVQERERQQRAALPAGEPSPGPGVAEFLQAVRREDEMAVVDARYHVKPEHLPELLAAYWIIDSWEERALLMELFADHFVTDLEGGEEVMRHFLSAPIGNTSGDIYGSAKVTALCQLAHDWDLFEQTWYNPRLRNAAIQRVLAGERPSLALLDELESDFPSPSHAKKSMEAKREKAVAAEGSVSKTQPRKEPEPQPSGPTLAELLEVARHGDEMEVREARAAMSPQVIPELLTAYGTLESWEERAGLMQLFADDLVEGGEKVMLHFLTSPLEDDYTAWGKVVALCQLAGSWELFEPCWNDPDLRRAVIRRTLKGQAPDAALRQEQTPRSRDAESRVAKLLEIAKRGDKAELQEAHKLVTADIIQDIGAAVHTRETMQERFHLMQILAAHLEATGQIGRKAPPAKVQVDISKPPRTLREGQVHVPKYVEIIKRGKPAEIERARGWVTPIVLAQLLSTYWTLESWEEKRNLVQLYSDHLMTNCSKVMRDFLTCPLEDDYTAWGKAVALCQLAGTWKLFEPCWQNRALLEALIERTLAGEKPTPLLLHELSRQVPRSPKPSPPDPEKRWWEFWK